MATKVLKPKLYLVIFLSVLCHFCSPSISNHHHSLPKPQKIVQTGKFVQNNKNYPFRTTFIETGETRPVAELDWRLDGEASLVEFRLRTAVFQRDNTASEWIAFGMSSNGSLIDADLIVVWLHRNKIEFKVSCVDKDVAVWCHDVYWFDNIPTWHGLCLWCLSAWSLLSPFRSKPLLWFYPFFLCIILSLSFPMPLTLLCVCLISRSIYLFPSLLTVNQSQSVVMHWL